MSFISAGVVATSGIVGWVGLVIPHMARALVGPDHGRLLPVSALIGAIYLLLVDDIARTATVAEIADRHHHRADRRAGVRDHPAPDPIQERLGP